MAQRMNLEVTVSDLHIEQVEADEKTAKGLNIAVGKKVTRVQRVMRADSRPVAFLIDSLPEDFLKPSDLSEKFRGSVLDFLLSGGKDLQVSRAAVFFISHSTKPSACASVIAERLGMRA